MKLYKTGEFKFMRSRLFIKFEYVTMQRNEYFLTQVFQDNFIEILVEAWRPLQDISNIVALTDLDRSTYPKSIRKIIITKLGGMGINV